MATNLESNDDSSIIDDVTSNNPPPPQWTVILTVIIGILLVIFCAYKCIHKMRFVYQSRQKNLRRKAAFNQSIKIANGDSQYGTNNGETLAMSDGGSDTNGNVTYSPKSNTDLKEIIITDKTPLLDIRAAYDEYRSTEDESIMTEIEDLITEFEKGNSSVII